MSDIEFDLDSVANDLARGLGATDFTVDRMRKAAAEIRVLRDQVMKQEAELSALREYRTNIDFPIESLAIRLSELGYKGEGMADAEIVEAARKKLNLLYRLVLVSGMNEKLLKACMEE